MLQRLDGGDWRELCSFDFLNKHHLVVRGVNCLPVGYGNHLAYSHGGREVQSYTPAVHSFCKSSQISYTRVCPACRDASHAPPSNTFSPSCSMFDTDFLRTF